LYTFYLSSNFRKRKGVYLFIYLPILEREKVSKKTVRYIWCFGPCGLKLEAGMLNFQLFYALCLYLVWLTEIECG
jgi:hypothetical protein